MTDDDDSETEAAWCAERFLEVKRYLAEAGIRHGEIPDWPVWHVAPYVSVWPVESGVRPGALGWWAICGDLPTDYLSGHDAENPRSAVRAFAARWSAAATSMARGEAPENFAIGPRGQWEELAPMLRSRAQVLESWADDDELWEGLE
jgi:hypothetical protein